MGFLILRAMGAAGVVRNAAGFATTAWAGRTSPSFLPTPHHSDGDNKPFSMIMFGKPGAGKGTISARLVKKYDILSLSTGDLLRTHIQDRTDVGRQAEEIVAQGGLLPDELMLAVVSSKFESLKNQPYLLDGFPRTVQQAKLLDAHLKKRNTPLSLVVHIDVPDNLILKRISDRWVHIPSGRVYNMSYNPPRVEGFDNETGEKLTKRPDDNPEIFARRLKQFYESTSPLLQYYGTTGAPANTRPLSTQTASGPALININGTTSDEIWPELDHAIQTLFPSLRQRPESHTGRLHHSLSDALAASGGSPSRAAAALRGFGRNED